MSPLDEILQSLKRVAPLLGNQGEVAARLLKPALYGTKNKRQGQPRVRVQRLTRGRSPADYFDYRPGVARSLEHCQSNVLIRVQRLRNTPCYGTNPILNDLIVAVAFDKTILALIPVKFDGNIILLTWKVAGAPTVVLFVPIRTT